MTSTFDKISITFFGALAMGTCVMIGAGIFALTGQFSQLSESLFHLSFIASENAWRRCATDPTYTRAESSEWHQKRAQ